MRPSELGRVAWRNHRPPGLTRIWQLARVGLLGVKLGAMTRSQALADIRQALARLCTEIRLDNAAGYLSQNKLLENLTLPVLRVVLNAPGLQNANAVTINQAHIDLIDAKQKLAVQVTTTREASKITGTLKGFLEAKKHRNIRTLKFVVFADPCPNYRSATTADWKRICRGKLAFLPARDVIDLDGLFRLIDDLSHAKLIKVRDIIAQSVVGSEYIDVAAAFAGQAGRQVEDEKASGKYIPDVFVETASAKSQARLFLHPFLFFERILDRCDRRRLPLLNRLLQRCGLTPVPMPDRTRYDHDDTWAGLIAAADRLATNLAAVETTVAGYAAIEHGKPPPTTAKPESRHYYAENAYRIKNWVDATNEWIGEMREELKILRSRVFILTGKAGQGKTNLVCDLVERFVLRHGIPCIYFTGLQLGRVSADLPDHIRKTLFKDKVPAFEDAIRFLGDHATERKQPFVVFIEGLNEHTRLAEFAGQLEELIKAALKHPSIRLFLTCRSEYFEQRFGVLHRAPFAPDLHVLVSAEQRMGEDERARMVAGYFKFFGINPAHVADSAADTLGKDTLLLRFFCEAYGPRRKPAAYQMPQVNHIYRAQIFDYYLKTKLQSAAAARDRLSGSPTVRGTEANLFQVIKLIVGHMVTHRKFADVPLSAVPADKETELHVLLGEDIVLCRDPVNNPTYLGPTQDVLNFTYDEFRDFLIARYLIDHVYSQGQQVFLDFLAAGANGAENISEGVKRFLFYWSRAPENATFWQFYSTQQAYAESYPEEIFSIDEAHLHAADRQQVRQIVEVGDKTARRVASRLIPRLPSRYPLLNLELLIETVAARDDAFHAALIEPIFSPTYDWHERQSAVEAFCESIEKRILPQLNPAAHQAIFDFLPMLLPIEPEPGLESPAMVAFRKFVATVPAVCINGLLRSLQYGFTRHRPYVWRLLTEFIPKVLDPVATRTMAADALGTASTVTAIEINRFLARVPAP
jgi:hypothetical protein